MLINAKITARISETNLANILRQISRQDFRQHACPFSRQFSYQEFPKRFLPGSPTKILVKLSARFMPRVFLPGNPPRFQPGSNSFSLYFIGTSCGVWTAGGNGNGGCCVFPFNYHGIKYFTCTYQDHSNPWCAISSDFDHDGVWGECIGDEVLFGSWEEAQLPTNFS